MIPALKRTPAYDRTDILVIRQHLSKAVRCNLTIHLKVLRIKIYKRGGSALQIGNRQGLLHSP